MLGTAPARVLERRNRRSLKQVGLVLMYHRIGPGFGDPGRELVPQLDLQTFRDQLSHLWRRYRIVALRELHSSISARAQGEPIPIALTFDDDLSAHARYAVPALVEAGAAATFFLSGSIIGGEPSPWWRDLQAIADRGGPEWRGLAGELGRGVGGEPTVHTVARTIEAMPPPERERVAQRMRDHGGAGDGDRLSLEEIERIAAAGFELGFHTLRHHNLQTVPDERLQAELTDGLSEIEALSGRPPTSIAYPHCRADARIVQAARAAGFELGCICDGGAVTAWDDPLMTDRIDPWSRSTGRFALRLARAVGARPDSAPRSAATQV